MHRQREYTKIHRLNECSLCPHRPLSVAVRSPLHKAAVDQFPSLHCMNLLDMLQNHKLVPPVIPDIPQLIDCQHLIQRQFSPFQPTLSLTECPPVFEGNAKRLPMAMGIDHRDDSLRRFLLMMEHLPRNQRILQITGSQRGAIMVHRLCIVQLIYNQMPFPLLPNCRDVPGRCFVE